jgi:hypothetical protein
MRRFISVIVPATSVLLLSLVCFSVLYCNPLNSDDEPSAPAFSTDLRRFGYAIPTDKRDVRAYSFMKDPVAFLDDGTLAVSFFEKNEHPGLSRRDGTLGGWFLFHTVLLNPVTGDVVGQRNWGNAGYSNSLLPLQNGNFFVQSDEWLMIYSKELHEITRMKVKVSGDILPRFSVSPSGRSLYDFMDAYDIQHGWLTTINLLDTVTLEPKQSKLTPGHADETVSDTQVVYSLANPRNELALFVYNVDGSSTPWGPMLLKKGDKLAGLLSRSDCKSVSFVDNTVLAVTGDCPLLLLLESGKTIALLHCPRGYRFGGDVQPSRHHRRFAFVRYQERGESSPLTDVEVSVYDLEGQKEIFIAKVAPVPKFKFAFALSPDGSLLAVQADSLLRVWRLASPH